MSLPPDMIRAAAIGLSENANFKNLSNSSDSIERQFLLKVARLSLEQAGGYQAAMSLKALPEADNETLYPACMTKAQQHLKLMLKGGYEELLRQWLLSLEEYQQSIPHELLPLVLDYGSKSITIQRVIRQTIGARGRWLAKQARNETGLIWINLTESISKDREYESLYDAWRDYLIRLRQIDPTRGRLIVEQYWQYLDSSMQIHILKALGDNLQSEDTPFLESLLENETTRFELARLLMKIPSSAFYQEAAAKLERLLILCQMGHRKQWVVDFAWSHAFDNQTLQITRSEATELCKIAGENFNPEILLMILPLEYWYKRYGVNAEILVEAARNSTRPTMFYRIWTELARENKDYDFLFALVMTVPRYSQAASRAIKTEQREKAALYWLETNPRFSLSHSVIPLLDSHVEAWSEDLGRAFLKSLEISFLETARPLLDGSIRHKLKQYAHYFPISLRAEMERVLSVNERGDLSETELEQANGILNLINFRAEIAAALAAGKGANSLSDE